MGIAPDVDLPAGFTSIVTNFGIKDSTNDFTLVIADHQCAAAGAGERRTECLSRRRARALRGQGRGRQENKETVRNHQSHFMRDYCIPNSSAVSHSLARRTLVQHNVRALHQKLRRRNQLLQQPPGRHKAHARASRIKRRRVANSVPDRGADLFLQLGSDTPRQRDGRNAPWLRDNHKRMCARVDDRQRTGGGIDRRRCRGSRQGVSFAVGSGGAFGACSVPRLKNDLGHTRRLARARLTLFQCTSLP